MNREDLAWAAGLYEGEGTTSASPRKGSLDRYQRRTTLLSTDEDVVRRFQAVMGFGHIRGPLRLAEVRKTAWDWQALTFEQIQATAALLWGWLSPRRREQFRYALTAGGGPYYRSGHRGQAMAWFGKRAKDLTPEEQLEYRRRSANEWYARNKLLSRVRP